MSITQIVTQSVYPSEGSFHQSEMLAALVVSVCAVCTQVLTHFTEGHSPILQCCRPKIGK